MPFFPEILAKNGKEGFEASEALHQKFQVPKSELLALSNYFKAM